MILVLSERIFVDNSRVPGVIKKGWCYPRLTREDVTTMKLWKGLFQYIPQELASHQGLPPEPFANHMEIQRQGHRLKEGATDKM